MFYTPEILCVRKNGKLARVWLAATLSQRLFKQSVSNRVLLSINIVTACEEILRVICSGGGERNMRFSLYLSSQLMYGAIRLFSYQATVCLSSMFKIHYEPVDDSLTRKKRRTSSEFIITDIIDLPDPPPITNILKNITATDDLHRLPEFDLECIRTGHVPVHVESLSFGALTDEQVGHFLMEGDFRLQTLYDRDQAELQLPIRWGAENSNQILGSAGVPRPIAQEDEDVGWDKFSAVKGSVAAEARGESIKTPKKREGHVTNADTPTKRRRRNLGTGYDEAARQNAEDQIQPPANLPDEGRTDVPANIPENVPGHQPIDLPADFMDNQPIDQPARFMDHQTIDRPPDIPSNIPVDSLINHAVPPANRSQEMTANQENLHLESLEMEITRQARTRRIRKRIDEHTSLSDAEFRKQTTDVTIQTVPKESVQIVPEKRRVVPAISLLEDPSTIFQTTNWHPTVPRYVKWASKLYTYFEIRTIGPFHAEDDVSMNAEDVRAADSQIQPIPEEISSGLGRAGLESSSARNKTADEPGVAEAELINPPVVPGIPEDDDQPPITNVGLHDITNEPILENTAEADTVSVTNQPESEEFLPEEVLTKTVMKKEKAPEKNSKFDEIINLHDSSVSMSSEESLQSSWTKCDLWATLEVYWRDDPILKLSQLLPMDTTTKLDAATCFVLLLELSQEAKVKLAQAEPYDDIYITKITIRLDDEALE